MTSAAPTTSATVPTQFAPTEIQGCHLCGSTSAWLIESRDRHGQPLDVVVCGGCGLVQNKPIPTAAELARFYQKDYRVSYKGIREPKMKHAVRYFQWVADHLQAHADLYRGVRTVLDMGSGSGEFLYLLQQCGRVVMGVEPNEDYAAFTREKLGLNVTTSDIDGFEPGHKFDLIRLNHVVEHLRDPIDKLKRIRAWLNPEGMLYLKVPDFRRYCRTKSVGGLFHYGHIYNFDHYTVTQLIEAAGLKVVRQADATAVFARLDQEVSPRRSAANVEANLAAYAAHRRAEHLTLGQRWAKVSGKVGRFFSERRKTAGFKSYAEAGRAVAVALTKSINPL